MIDSPISPATLRRQILREGKRWGLVPEYDANTGTTRVVETVRVAASHDGVGTVEKVANRRICTVDDEHPFSAALANRVRNGEVDLAARYRMLDVLEAKANRTIEQARDAEIKARWLGRKKIIALPTGIVPAGLKERARLARVR